MKRTIAFGAAGFLLLASAVTGTAAFAGGHGDGNGLSVCHPVNGAGELGNGWNLIGPDHASSHIDDDLYPDGEYWKHDTNDGRHDVYATEAGQCPTTPPPPVDVCPDLEGDQPEGTICTPPVVDVCPDLPGDQPEGTDCDPVVPPVDACPDIEGNQAEGTDCDPVEPPVDVCPDVPGDQAEGTDCNPVGPPVEPPVVTPPVVDVPTSDVVNDAPKSKPKKNKSTPKSAPLPNTGA